MAETPALCSAQLHVTLTAEPPEYRSKDRSPFLVCRRANFVHCFQRWRELRLLWDIWNAWWLRVAYANSTEWLSVLKNVGQPHDRTIQSSMPTVMR